MKDGIQDLVNEVKSMTEIISILKEERKYQDASSRERETISTYTCKQSTDLLYCGKCSELEIQLKDALSELSSVKLITEMLNNEIKLLKQTSQNDSNLEFHGYMQQGIHAAQLLLYKSKKIVQPMEFQLFDSIRFQLPINMIFYQIDKMHRNLVTYSPIISNNHQT